MIGMSMIAHKLFYICFICLLLCCSVASVGNVQGAKRSRLPSIEQLQAKGNQHLQLENYKHASHCYSAVLQLAEGALDEEQMQTRRLCGLQLGKCEMKLGNLPSAIARFCEVISEAPDNAQNENTPQKRDLSRVSSHHLSRDLQRAHFLRALCLQCLHRPQLSALDIAASASYQTNHDNDNDNNNMKQEEQTSLDAELNAFAEGIAEGETENDEVFQSSEDLQEAHTDFLEECVLNHPTPVFTKKQLRRLIRDTDNIVPITAAPADNYQYNMQPQPDLSALFGLNSNPAGAVNNYNSQSAMGGMGLTQMISMVPMICSFTGVHPETGKLIVKVLTIAAKIVAAMQSVYRTVRTNSNNIVVFMTAVWLAAFARSYFNAVGK